MYTLRTIIWLLLCTISAAAFGQQVTPQKYIYRLLISKQVANKSKPEQKDYCVVQTGFKLKNSAGILTALHGFTGPDKIKSVLVESWYEDAATKQVCRQEIGNSKINGNNVYNSYVKISDDLIFIPVDKTHIGKDDGLTIAKGNLSKGKKLQIIGHGNGVQVQDEVKDASINESAIELRHRLGNDQTLFNDRKSPSIELKVITIDGALGPGYSGAPVLLDNYHVIGVLDGGLSGLSKAWATNIMSLTFNNDGTPLGFEHMKNKNSMVKDVPFTQNPQGLFSMFIFTEQLTEHQKKEERRKLRLPAWSFGIRLWT